MTQEIRADLAIRLAHNLVTQADQLLTHYEAVHDLLDKVLAHLLDL